MPALNVNTGPFEFERGAFRPRGRLEAVGAMSANPRTAYGAGVYSALVLVGLTSRDGETEFAPEDVITAVTDLRTAQAGDPGASFLLQRGVYKHKATGEVVEEESLRIIILHLTDEPRADFKENILVMAEELAREFEQDEVIVEFQDRGVSEAVFG